MKYEWYNPVRTQRCFDVHTTSFQRYGRCMNVKTTSCAYWESLLYICVICVTEQQAKMKWKQKKDDIFIG